MASRRIDDLDPVLAYAFGKAEAEWRIKFPELSQPFLTCTYRSKEEQTALYNQPFDKKDNDGDGKVDEADEKVTNAKAGQSAHNYQPRLAFDVAFKKKNGQADWNTELFTLFSKLVLQTAGITWGGHFKSLKDAPHFERTGWEKLVKK
ncbi:peptidoglycan L-alanyl-D-glutamate endopeptidase CwlK [Larkinella arboricola]|uniref:Peptidoglycan L-alanyl-D-glutamate endopeptidase CwlK n=1 Tax=Larkinella arboricola TaxID=643671 RepID=A0A327WLP7_LARAB|nr:M15 family metallopeptidase [Larkinella arboricola]RAJ92205.1 peptidoglycan L-alanyl-D-glutamate endopeptidase CwlK [Larkinella arboricola]